MRDESHPEKIKGIPFGYKNAWFVFKSNNYAHIHNALKKYLTEIRRTTLSEGLKEGWNGNWCLIQPINGHILLVSSEGFSLTEKMKDLSLQLGEIHFYATHRSNDFLACSKFINGELVREFAISDGEIHRNIGTPTQIEMDIALGSGSASQASVNNIEGVNKLLLNLGNEDDLMRIAENWSINPSRLDEYEVGNSCIVYKI